MDRKDTKKENNVPSPYLFILREGKKIDCDFLDYSLVLLKMSGAEILPTPNKLKAAPYIPFGQVIQSQKKND